MVKKELYLFRLPYRKPEPVRKHSPQLDILDLHALLYGSQHKREIHEYGMTPRELSYLCCDRWLSSSHMYWMASKQNAAQKDTLCVYLNHVGSIPRFFRKRIKPREKPTKSMFLLNVSRDENHLRGFHGIGAARSS